MKNLSRLIRASALMPPVRARAVIAMIALAMSRPLVAASGADILRTKISMPTELRTVELSRLPVWIRERAFFMAAVDRGEILDAFRERAQRIANGELSVAQARQELYEELDRLDYKPLPGQEGTIKDLRTIRRMNVALETNVLQVNGYAQWTRQQAALAGFPAQQFVRLRMSNVPRQNWPERFAAAVNATTTVGANIPAMSALVNHPCWIALSVFGTPYSPFDFNSGMGLEPLDRRESEELGLLPGDDADPAHAAMMEPQTRGLNETLESKPTISSQKIRSEVAESLQGLAKWEGDTLRFTDPNGTRPYSASDLADLWSEPLPDGIPALQKDSFTDWVSDHFLFQNKNDRNQWSDLQRLHARLKNEKAPLALYRGLKLSDQDAHDFLRNIQRDGYSVRQEFPVESWTDSVNAASFYASGGKMAVVLKVSKPSAESFKDIAPLVRAFKNKIRKQPAHPIETESEWLLGSGRKFSVSKVERADRAVVIHLEGEETL